MCNIFWMTDSQISGKLVWKLHVGLSYCWSRSRADGLLCKHWVLTVCSCSIYPGVGQQSSSSPSGHDHLIVCLLDNIGNHSIDLSNFILCLWGDSNWDGAQCIPHPKFWNCLQRSGPIWSITWWVTRQWKLVTLLQIGTGIGVVFDQQTTNLVLSEAKIKITWHWMKWRCIPLKSSWIEHSWPRITSPVRIWAKSRMDQDDWDQMLWIQSFWEPNNSMISV
jgi:hypothetical protein